MPYKSEAQRRWAHTAAGTQALGGKGKVAEWDKATKAERQKLKERSTVRKFQSPKGRTGKQMLAHAMKSKRK